MCWHTQPLHWTCGTPNSHVFLVGHTSIADVLMGAYDPEDPKTVTPAAPVPSYTPTPIVQFNEEQLVPIVTRAVQDQSDDTIEMLRSNSGSDEAYTLQTPTRCDDTIPTCGKTLCFLVMRCIHEDVRMSPEDEHISKLEEGTVVWAKQTGFPRWPVMIKKDQEDGDFLKTPMRSDTRNMYRYHVIYFNEKKKVLVTSNDASTIQKQRKREAC